VRHLRGRIAAKVAERKKVREFAASASSRALIVSLFVGRQHPAEISSSAEKAIRGATGVKDRQVVDSPVLAPLAHPIRHTLVGNGSR